MKKSIISVSILNKVNNGTALRFLRKIHNNFEMHHQQGHQQYFKNRPNMQQHSREDVLRNFRKWIRTEVAEKPGEIFTVFNYNILSQKLLEMHSYLYTRHEKVALQWDLRLHNIIGEIIRYKPSILCCQVSKKSCP